MNAAFGRPRARAFSACRLSSTRGLGGRAGRVSAADRNRVVVRVMLVDDHASFPEPLSFMVEREPDFTVVAQAGTLAEAQEVLRDASASGTAETGIVDVAIVDLNLPDGEGIELIWDLRAANPRCAVLVLSAVVGRAQIARAVEAGASGVLHKSTRIKEVIAAARRVVAGEHLLSREELREMLALAGRQREEEVAARAFLGRLTRREKEVLQAFAKGLTDPEIAARLYVSPGTVRTHMANVLAKLETGSRLQALMFAVRHGAVKLG